MYIWEKKIFCTREKKVRILSLHFNCPFIVLWLYVCSSSKLYWTWSRLIEAVCIKHKQTLPNMLWMETWTTHDRIVLLWTLKRLINGFYSISSQRCLTLTWSKLKETCKKKTPNDRYQVYTQAHFCHICLFFFLNSA